MRLINVSTFTLQEFAGSDAAPQYAILSHTWGKDEVSYQDFQDSELAQRKAGFNKIRFTCEQAKLHGLHYAWVDTCCIDKTSSHELSEAINSMFRWYMNAAVCYVYLSDIPGNCPSLAEEDLVLPSGLRWIEAFEDSRWFTRGWTLQELIAPPSVLFFGAYWNFIGALADMVLRVSNITNIQTDILDHSRPVSDLSIAQRLSWAAKRNTTRIEDQAYSLFGILDVNMPLLYGEGEKAFLRLQEHIISQSTDQSIFAWDAPSGPIMSRELLLAPSPRCFLNGSRIRRRQGTASESAFRVSNKGLEITLPIVRRRLYEATDCPYVTLGLLDCRYENSPEVLALVMNQHPYNTQDGTPALELYVSGFEKAIGDTFQYARVLKVSAKDRADAKPTLVTITRDLQSLKYIQAFNTNEASWFPLRFMGGDPSRLPSLRNVFPNHRWHEGSNTMRLRIPQDRYGGVVVDVQFGRSVLIGFGVHPSSSHHLTPARSIYGPVFIDPDCQIQPHLYSLARRDHTIATETASLRLSRTIRMVVQLWRGALIVSSESGTEDRAIGVPVSPRRLSVPVLSRRDSLLQNNPYLDLPDEPQYDAPSQRVDFSPQCEVCRESLERERHEREHRREEQRKRVEDEKAQRQKVERQRKNRDRATQAATGLGLGAVLADVADVASFFG